MSVLAPNSATPSIRVLVVDDSAVVRGLTSRWLGAEADIDFVGSAIDGLDGVAKAKALQPDVIVLDVEMPRLDGLAALPKFAEAAPRARIVMASTLTHRNADITLKALAAGAADYIPKPETTRLGAADDYRHELLAKVRALGTARPAADPGKPAWAQRAAAPIKLIKPGLKRPKALAIGASTGGPQALRAVVQAIGGKLDAPILITQHMPRTFTTILAEHLDKLSSAKAVEAEDGMPVRSGQIYVAPGDFHMTVKRRAGALAIALDQTPPQNFCRPAVDPLFRSCADVWGDELLAIVLTGMGSDGKLGAEAVTQVRGSVIAQDEASSVVWGMPGAVTRAGLASAVLPLDAIPTAVIDRFRGKTI